MGNHPGTFMRYGSASTTVDISTSDLDVPRIYDHVGGADTANWHMSFWWRFDSSNSGNVYFFRVSALNVFDVRYRVTQNDFQIKFSNTIAGVKTLTIDSPTASPQDGDLFLVSVYYDSVGNDIGMIIRSADGVQSGHREIGIGADLGKPATPFDWGIGDPVNGSEAAQGDIICFGIGTLAGANTVVTEAASLEMWNSKRPDATLNYPIAPTGSDYSESSSIWGGQSSLEFATFFGALSDTEDAVVGSNHPTGSQTLACFNGSGFDNTITATFAGTLTWIDYFAEESYFEQTGPQRTSGPSTTTVSATLPDLAAWSEDTMGRLVRVMSSANSRDAGRGLNDGWERNHHMAIIRERESQTVGTIIQAPYDNNRERFGIQGNVFLSGGAALAGDTTNWTRVGVSAWTSTITGQGKPMLLPKNAQYAFRCPENEGGIDGSAEVEVSIVYLVPPQGGRLTYVANKHNADAAVAGTDEGSTATADIDGSATTIDGSDFVSGTTTQVVVSGDYSASVSVNDTAMGDPAGTGWELNQVSGVSYNGGSDQTTIDFRYAWSTAIGSGDDIYTTAFALGSVTVTVAAVSGGNTYRGARLQNDSLLTNPPPIVILGHGIINNEATTGQIVGHTGASGDGYDEQLGNFVGLFSEIARVTQPDAWLQFHAQQGSDEDSMTDFTNQILDGHPDTEMMWVGEPFHGTESTGADQTSAGNSTQDAWNNYTIDSAASGAIVMAEEAGFGRWMEQVARGQRNDGAHYSSKGHLDLITRLRTLVNQTAGTSATGRTGIRLRASCERDFRSMRGRAK